MNIIKFIKSCLFICLFAPAASMAENFINNEHGYVIEINDSYQVIRSSNVTYFKSKDSDTLVIIKHWPGLTEEQAREYLLQGYQDETLAVVATGEAKEIKAENGTGQIVDILGIFERKLMKGVAGGFIGNNGQGIVVLASSTEAQWGKFAPEAQKITESVKLVEYGPGPDVRDWYYMLAGTRLSLRGTTDNRRRREDLYICSDGNFQHRFSSAEMMESGSGSAFGYSTKTGSGSWEVVDDDGDNRLILHYSDGADESAVLEDKDGQTFLNGQRYYMMRNDRCR